MVDATDGPNASDKLAAQAATTVVGGGTTVAGTRRPVLLVGLGGMGTGAVAHVLRRLGGRDAYGALDAICLDTMPLTGQPAWVQDTLEDKDTYIDIMQLPGQAPVSLDFWRQAQRGQMSADEYERSFGWYEEGIRISAAAQRYGAGAVRQVGRLAYVRAITQGDRVDGRFGTAFAKLTGAQAGGAHAAANPLGLQIVVVAGTAGGTGCGTFIDVVAHLGRKWRDTFSAATEPDIRAMLVLPDVWWRLYQGNSWAVRYKPNCYALLKELDAILQDTDGSSMREILLPQLIDDAGSGRLSGDKYLSLAYVVEGHLSAGSTVTTVDDLYHAVGQSLYALTVASTGNAVEMGAQVNGVASTQRGGLRTAYSTIGCARAVVPRDSVIRYMGARLFADAAALATAESLSPAASQRLREEWEQQAGHTIRRVLDDLTAPLAQMEALTDDRVVDLQSYSVYWTPSKLAKERDYTAALTRCKDELSAQRAQLEKQLGEDLEAVLVPAVKAARTMLEGYVAGCDAGLVYADRAIRELDSALEARLEDVNASLDQLRGDVDEAERQLAAISADARRADVNPLVKLAGRINKAMSRDRLAEDTITKAVELQAANLRLLLLAAEKDYLERVASKSGSLNDSDVDETGRVLGRIRAATSQIRTSLHATASSPSFDITDADGTNTISTYIYPDWLRDSLADASPLSARYVEWAKPGETESRVPELSAVMLATVRKAGLPGWLSWADTDASSVGLREAWAWAMRSAVSEFVAQLLPKTIWEAASSDAGGSRGLFVSTVCDFAEPMATLLRAPAYGTITACVDDAKAATAGSPQNASLVEVGTPHEVLVMVGHHGYLLGPDFVSVLDLHQEYSRFVAQPGRLLGEPVHLDNSYVDGLPPLITKDLGELPEELYEALLFGFFSGRLLSALRERTLADLRISVEPAIITRVADLQPAICDATIREPGWKLYPYAYHEDTRSFTYSPQDPVVSLGVDMKEVVANLQRAPLGKRQAARMLGMELLEAASSTDEQGAQAMLALIEDFRSSEINPRFLGSAKASPEEQQIWSRLAKELAEAEEVIVSTMRRHGWRPV